MEKTRKKKAESKGSVQMLLPLLGLMATINGALFELVLGSGLGVLQALLEQEREQLCGTRYRHDPTRKASRAGYADEAELVLGGRRVAVKRPRVRSNEGKEVPLPSWERFATEDPLNERAVEQMVLGVATRKYARSLEPLPAGTKSRGTSKSAVSRRFVEETGKNLKDWLSRSLSELSLAVLMLDGIVCGEHTVLVALGMDENGSKHVLGLWEGATENAVACTGLLSSLVERGLNTTRAMLVVIDGSKALAKAARDTFGKSVAAPRSRCRIAHGRSRFAMLIAPAPTRR
jgi:putative transposase